MGDTLLLNNNIFSIYEGITMKKMIINRGKNKIFLYLPTIVHQAVLPGTNIPLTGVNIPYLNYGNPHSTFLVVFL